MLQMRERFFYFFTLISRTDGLPLPYSIYTIADELQNMSTPDAALFEEMSSR